MNKVLRNALLGGTALVGAGLLNVPGAKAQTAALPGGVVPVQQTAARADAAAFEAMPANGYTACGATAASAANLTLTVTAPAGNYIYLTGFDVTVAMATTTGSSSTVTWSTNSGMFNVQGGAGNILAWETTGGAGTGQAAGQGVAEVFPTGLKSLTTGSVLTITPNATMTSGIQCPHAYGFFSPA